MKPRELTQPRVLLAGVAAAFVAVGSASGGLVAPAAAHGTFGLDVTGPALSGVPFRFEREDRAEVAGNHVETETAWRKSGDNSKGGGNSNSGGNSGGGNKGGNQKQVDCSKLTHSNPTVQQKMRMMCERNKR